MLRLLVILALVIVVGVVAGAMPTKVTADGPQPNQTDRSNLPQGPADTSWTTGQEIVTEFYDGEPHYTLVMGGWANCVDSQLYFRDVRKGWIVVRDGHWRNYFPWGQPDFTLMYQLTKTWVFSRLRGLEASRYGAWLLFFFNQTYTPRVYCALLTNMYKMYKM